MPIRTTLALLTFGGLLAGVVFGLFVGAVRIVQGAHFATDVMAAGFFVLAINLGLARVILRERTL